MDFFKVTCQGGGKTPARIEIRGPIDMKWDAKNYTITDTETEILKLLEGIAENQETHVHVSSEGGSVKMALGIHNALRPRAAKLTFHNAGIMFSSATILAPKGSKVITPKASLYGIHQPSVPAMSGTAAELRTAAKNLDAVEDVIAGIYAERTGKTVETCKAMMARTTLMSGERAVEEGFADETGDEDEEPDKDDVARNALSANVTMRFTEIPQEFRDRIEAQGKVRNSFSNGDCIAACRVCLAACQSCLDECKACPDTSSSLHQDCIKECEACVEKCNACITDLSRGGDKEANLATCRSCAASCEKCRTACMECAGSCGHCAPYCNTCAEECAECAVCCNDAAGPQDHLKFRARLEAQANGGSQPPPTPTKEENRMKKLLALLVEAKLIASAELNEDDAVAQARASLNRINTEQARLKTENDGHVSALKVRVENRVKAAIEAKKVKPEREASLIALGTANEANLDFLDDIAAPQAAAPATPKAQRGSPPAPALPGAEDTTEQKIENLRNDLKAEHAKGDKADALRIGNIATQLRELRGHKDLFSTTS